MESKFIRADEVANELGVSKPYAYKLIRQLNEELNDKGFRSTTNGKKIPMLTLISCQSEPL